MQEALGPIAGGYSCDYNAAFGISIFDRLGKEKGLQTQAKDLATFESEHFQIDPIGNYTLQVKQAQFIDKVSGIFRNELTLVDTVAQEPMAVWTDAGEHGTGTKEEYSRLVTWAHELAEKEGEATLSWMSRGQKREDGKPEHRLFVLKKKDNGQVEASMYSLTGSENALSSMMERLGFEQQEDIQSLEERRLLTEGTSNFSHTSVFDAYTSSLSRTERHDHAGYIDHFRKEATEVSDAIRLARIAHRQEIFEKMLAESDKPLQEALGAIVQGFAALPRIVSENGYVTVAQPERNESVQVITPLPVSIERKIWQETAIQSYEHAKPQKRADGYTKVSKVDEKNIVEKTKRERAERKIFFARKQTIHPFEKRNIQDTFFGNEYRNIKTGFGLEAFAILQMLVQGRKKSILSLNNGDSENDEIVVGKKDGGKEKAEKGDDRVLPLKDSIDFVDHNNSEHFGHMEDRILSPKDGDSIFNRQYREIFTQLDNGKNPFSSDVFEDIADVMNFIHHERNILSNELFLHHDSLTATDTEHVIPSAVSTIEAIQILRIFFSQDQQDDDTFFTQFIENSKGEVELLSEEEEILFSLGKDVLNFMETEKNENNFTDRKKEAIHAKKSQKNLQILLEILSHADLPDEIHHVVASLLYRELLQISMKRKDELPIELAEKINEMKQSGEVFEHIGNDVDKKIQTFMGATGEIMKEILEVTPTDIVVAIATALENSPDQKQHDTDNIEGLHSEIPTREKMTQLKLKKIIVARKLIEFIHTIDHKVKPFILSGELMESNPLYLDISLILLLEHLDISFEIKDRLLQSLGIEIERLCQLISKHPEKIQNIPVNQIKTVFEHILWLRSQQNFKSFTFVFPKTKKKSSQSHLPVSVILFQYNTFIYE